MDKSSSTQQAYIEGFRRQKRIVTFWQIFICILFFALWEITTRVGLLNDFIFSSPSRILKNFWIMSSDGTLFYHIGITLFETFLSFFIVLFAGILLSVLLWWNRSLAAIIEPYLITLNSLPKTALAPIFIVWLGNNMKTIIVCAISLAIFGTVINLTACFNQMDPDKLLLIQTLGGGRREMLQKVIIPGSIPNIISNMKVNIGLCLVGVIIGEFLSANAGLGYLIVYGSQVFKLDWVLMSIVVLCIIAAALYGCLNLIEKIYNNRHK
ncbi:MAG: ABC transporter permease [Clostridia bacterium]|nr:ABC transporter permease [Clostridia bacterium]NCD03360.1 ABC transporter permease [Clostridia bacterium]